MSLNIKKAIKERGYEVREIAQKMNITPTGLSQHINGNPSVEVLERIASAIGCDISELFDKPKGGGTTIICPHCGNPIKINVELKK
jgi:transcriptional regulator with XRE-family HTH domain